MGFDICGLDLWGAFQEYFFGDISNDMICGHNELWCTTDVNRVSLNFKFFGSIVTSNYDIL